MPTLEYVKRYSLPSLKGEGWAIIFLDSTGCFSALSDWGNVGYRWPLHGLDGRDFRKFLLECDDDYLRSKFGQGRKVPDWAAVETNAKKLILEGRRDGTLNRDAARTEWEVLAGDSGVMGEMSYHEWFGLTELGAAANGVYREKYQSEVECFVKHVMPRLRLLLKEEVVP